MKPEALVAKRFSNHMQVYHSEIIFRFDLAADLKLTIGQAKRNKELHGKFNKSYPDVFIAKCINGYGGLYLELKKDSDDGTVQNSDHVRKQDVIHKILRKAGYKCVFAVGLEEAIEIVDDYLKS